MATKLTAIVIEALDVERLKAFWTKALADRGGDGIELIFEASARPKSGKNRMHLCLASGPDQAVTVQHLLDLGASRADIGQGDVPWDVLADPEGNEFCVLPQHEIDDGLFQVCLDAADPSVQGPFWTAATGWSITAQGDWGFRLRSADGIGPSLVMGPPATPKTGPNRLQPRFTTHNPDGARERLLTDPEGNEYRLL